MSSPPTVNLATSANYAVLAQTSITGDAGSNVITGNMGISPATNTGITGFALTEDVSNTFWTSAQVIGRVYTADNTGTTPATLTTAVSDMQAAYTDASGRTGTVVGSTLSGTYTTGVYTSAGAVSIPSSITLSGGVNDVFIFAFAGTLTTTASTVIILTGGAQASNIFWAIGGASATLGASSTFNGNILAGSSTFIAFGSGATQYGRSLSQTAVTFVGSDVITVPIPVLTVNRPYFEVFT